MTVAEPIARLEAARREAVAPIDNGGGLSRVADLAPFEPAVRGEPQAVLLNASLDE